jgi:hypothetical protein
VSTRATHTVNRLLEGRHDLTPADVAYHHACLDALKQRFIYDRAGA